MTQIQKPTKKTMIALWLSAQIIPIAFAVFISVYLLQKTSLSFEYSLPLMVAWGCFGAIIHYMSIKRGLKFRFVMIAIFAVLTTGLAIGLALGFAIDHSKLSTCPACGFISLPEAEETCPVCHSTLDEEHAVSEGFDSKDEYLIALQTILFMPIPPDTGINFFAPCNCNGNYTKDPAWKPSVSRQDVLDVQALTKGK